MTTLHPTMLTPTTKAGKALSVLLDEQGGSFDPDILAIEAEARQQERERIRAALEAQAYDGWDSGPLLAILAAGEEGSK